MVEKHIGAISPLDEPNTLIIIKTCDYLVKINKIDAEK